MKLLIKLGVFAAAGAALLFSLGTYQSYKNPPTRAQLEEARASVNIK